MNVDPAQYLQPYVESSDEEEDSEEQFVEEHYTNDDVNATEKSPQFLLDDHIPTHSVYVDMASDLVKSEDLDEQDFIPYGADEPDFIDT